MSVDEAEQVAPVQIGEVAERTQLSLRTIRYYEEVGIVTPSARSHGGFRLYSQGDVERLLVVRRMKPLDFSVEEMRELLGLVDALRDPATTPEQREPLLARLEEFRASADERCAKLLSRLAMAHEFAADLRSELRTQRGAGRS